MSGDLTPCAAIRRPTTAIDTAASRAAWDAYYRYLMRAVGCTVVETPTGWTARRTDIEVTCAT